MWLPHWPLPQWHHDMELGNTNLLKVMQVLGNPHLNLPPVIHVAGTNGKGSVVAFIYAILEESKLKLHRHTSPHLRAYNERFVINNSQLTDDQITIYLERVRVATEKAGCQLSFHAGTVAAFMLAASEHEADYLILETGMGGRLDPTNIIPQHQVAVITPISYDHMVQLGDHISQIASEKAGIMKAGCPCIIGTQVPQAEGVLRHHAKKIEATISCYGELWGITSSEENPEWFQYHSDQLILELPPPALLGRHQYLNAATAIAAVEQLNPKYCSQAKVRRAMKNVKWPGRLQDVTAKYRQYLPKKSKFYIDGAHNVTGAGVLADWLELRDDDREVILMVGLTYGKNISEFLEPFQGIVRRIIAVNVTREPSSYSANQIGVIAEEMGFDARVAEDYQDGLSYLEKESQPVTLLACGSLYLVAEFIE